MELLEQCQIWHEHEEYQKIIDTLEAIPAGERTPEMDMELARAYNNQADPEDKELFRKAISLLMPHEAYFQGDHRWNFRIAYAYYYLDQEGPALRYFEQALEDHSGDEETQSFIEECENRLALPQFKENFRVRTAKAWAAFVENEAELRRFMDADKNHKQGEELIAQCNEMLHIAFEDVCFEMGFNGEKYELILTPEGNKVKLFELVYFQRHAPASVLEHWNILVGRQRSGGFALRLDDWELSGKDVQVWVEKLDEHSVGLTLYCEKLLPLLQENEAQAEWMLYTITDQVLGEIPAMRYINQFEVVQERPEEPSILLDQLPMTLEGMGLDISTDAGNYLENSYTGYQMKPDEDPEANWRLDVMAGSTNCPAFINGYLNNENDYMDDLHADGVVAGFLCYPLDSFDGEDRTQQIFAFRDKLEETLLQQAGEEALTLTGGASGIYCGYLDFIAWDLPAVLNAAKDFFENSSLAWANFHVFRWEAATVPLVSKDEEEREAESLEKLECIPYTPENADAFYRQLEQWNDADEYTRCIKVLETIPEELWDYRAAYALTRALENYAIIGDHDEGTPREEGTHVLLRALDILESVRAEGENKAEWNMRMAYAYQYLPDEEKALPYAQRWAELDPDDKCAQGVIRECQQELEKKQRRAERKNKIKAATSSVPFVGFDFTNFWDDNEYARKAYVCDPPSDELIASIEQELGYKLPASYIWLMKQHNGGVPVNNRFPTDTPTSWAEDHIAINGIFGIGREKDYSLCGSLGSQFMIEEWEYPAIGVAICDCPSAGHDMIFLDYRECGPQGEPKVVHIDQEYDYDITPLADSFEEFIRGLVNEEEYQEDPEERKAEELEKVKSAPFSPLLKELCQKSDEPQTAERWIRETAAQIVEEKGFFALHDDETSFRLYDLQFWLYENAHPGVTEEEYLEIYPRLIALAEGFSTGGYGPSFITDWLRQRKEAGSILEQNGALTLSAAAKAELLKKS